MKRLLPLLAIPLLLTGCGLRPVYGGGTQGAVAQALGNVDVAPLLRDLLALPADPKLDGNDAPFRAVMKGR